MVVAARFHDCGRGEGSRCGERLKRWITCALARAQKDKPRALHSIRAGEREEVGHSLYFFFSPDSPFSIHTFFAMLIYNTVAHAK